MGKLTKRQRKLPLWMQIELLQGLSERDLLKFIVYKLSHQGRKEADENKR